MARRRFGDSRGRGAGYSDAEIRGLVPRFGLNEVQRSQSTESYNRRKPVLLSTDTPELAAVAVTNPKLGTNAVNNRTLGPDAVLNANIGEQINAGKLPNVGGLNGDVPANKLPSGVIIGNVQRGNIANKAVHPKDQVDWTVGVDDFIPVSKLASRPWPSVASVKAKTAPPDVVKLIRKYVKPASLK